MIKLLEMDRSRDVKQRGASRFSKQNKQSGFNVDCLSSEKSKFKKLSSVNKTNNEVKEEKCEVMGCDVLGREAEELPSQPTTKKFKLPRKLFEDCNGVDHATVPRKLRSAMKKRNRESLSPPFLHSKKLNHSNDGVQSSKKDGIKRSKRNGCPGWSQKQSVCGPITKDEEEVVETLYALAGMFPDSKLDGASLDVSCSASPEARANCPPVFEESIAVKEVLNSICFSTEPALADPTSIEQRPEETVKVNSSNDFSIKESHMRHGVEQHKTEIDGSVTQVDQLSLTMLSKNEEQKPLFNSNNFVLPELYLDPCKLKYPMKLETSLLDRKPDIALGLMTTDSQVNQQHMNNESKKEGPALWPGLSSTVSKCTWTVGLSTQHTANKIPRWMGTALCNGRPNSFQNGSSPGKWKRCAAHVHISRLTQALKTPESKDNFPLHQEQQKHSAIFKQGTLETVNDFNGVRTGLNRVKAANNITVDSERNSKESINDILLLRRLHHDQQPEAALASGMYPTQKQSYNFLSLSAGGGEANTSFRGSGNGSEPLAQLQVPYPHSNSQYHTVKPSSLSQTRYASTSYHDQSSVSAAQQGFLLLKSAEYVWVVGTIFLRRE